MLAIGKKLTPEQRLIKGTGDIIGNDTYVALAGVLMIGTKQISTKTKTACTNGRDEAYNPDFMDCEVRCAYFAAIAGLLK
jgi:hypothetical protein